MAQETPRGNLDHLVMVAKLFLEAGKKNAKIVVKDDLSDVKFAQIDPALLAQYQRLLFIDLDITCHDEHQLLDGALFRVLARLQSMKKILVIPTTGRPVTSPQFLARDHGLKPTIVIATNGTTVAYPDKHKNLIIQRADYKGILFDVITHLRLKHGLDYTLYWPYSQSTDLNIASHEVEIAVLQEILETDPEIVEKGAPFGGFKITPSGGLAVHLHLKKHTKGSAIGKLLVAADYPHIRTMYVGNGVNDVSVRPYVHHLMTVNNGENALKQVADYISPHDSSLGTLDALRKALLDQGVLTAAEWDHVCHE